MRRTGVSNLPLHSGKCPKWLFGRMKKMSGLIAEIIVDEYGQQELLNRLSNPFFFQSFACVLGFDWHSSGTTTTVCGALKESLNNLNLGIYVAGGKGASSKKTPDEITTLGDKLSLADSKINSLIYSSRMSAKVDNTAVQDGYQLYHHCFIFSEKGDWVVVQQGLNNNNQCARRYHWLSTDISDFVNEPQSAVCCDSKEKEVLNMVAEESREARKVSVELVNDNIAKKIRVSGQSVLSDFSGEMKKLDMPYYHEIRGLGKNTLEALSKAWEIKPKNYEELLSLRGIGPKSIRALALISQLIYGIEPSWKDPAKFSFAHGGKDGIPYPVDRKVYDQNIEILRIAVEHAKLKDKERINAIKRLNYFLQ